MSVFGTRWLFVKTRESQNQDGSNDDENRAKDQKAVKEILQPTQDFKSDPACRAFECRAFRRKRRHRFCRVHAQ